MSRIWIPNRESEFETSFEFVIHLFGSQQFQERFNLLIINVCLPKGKQLQVVKGEKERKWCNIYNVNRLQTKN